GTYGSGIYKISSTTKDTLQILKPSNIHLTTYDLFPYKNFVLEAASGGIIKIFENNSYQFIEVETGTNFSSFTKSTAQNKIFLGSFGNGLFVADESMHFQPFTGFENNPLPTNLIIQDILIDSSDKLWIATYGKGAYLVDFEKETIQNFVANKTNPYALHYNDVLSLYEDFTGTVWLGTDGSGLSYYDEYLVKFNVLTNDQVPLNVDVDVIRAIAKDSENNIWVGTSGKGLTRLNIDKQNCYTYTAQNSDLL